MHDFNKIEITSNDIVRIAKEMICKKRRLVIINGYINENKENVICYNFDIDGKIDTYAIVGEKEIPSITTIYEASARWCEEEIEEMMEVRFIGLNRSGRLFLPEEFKEGEGQILIMPLEELKKLKEK
ncbi:NADH-quinone oxidoreductase subunit C [Clostridium sardiniense]|uniref:NADH-quinone oxidoreductase subunit C n=1 Tax=Clostridium sardiniense TaxID=29369 RepID=A0ABS7KZB8_CLOSR|nr:NADH-quinone oxidoreductase subunit C [Clostridium sardiniense]MBY0756161.1 NADH-quinone oxidoreductase subunit C [Clostridium sardiniense]MDQ0458896.1 uncharacterized protein YifN (PemK superfamily) [Clostridium sardiniense]